MLKPNWLLEQLRLAAEEAAAWSQWKREAMRFERIKQSPLPTKEQAMSVRNLIVEGDDALNEIADVLKE